MLFSVPFKLKGATFIYEEDQTRVTVDFRKRCIDVETNMLPNSLLRELFKKFTKLLTDSLVDFACEFVGAKWLAPVLGSGVRIKFTGEVDVSTCYPTNIHADILQQIYRKQYKQVLSRLLFSDEFNPLINFSNASQIYDYLDLLACYGVGDLLKELQDEAVRYIYKNRHVLIAQTNRGIFDFVTNANLLSYIRYSSKYDIREALQKKEESLRSIKEENILRCRTNMQCRSTAIMLVDRLFETIADKGSGMNELLGRVYSKSDAGLRNVFYGTDVELKELFTEQLTIAREFGLIAYVDDSYSGIRKMLEELSHRGSLCELLPPIIQFQFDRADWFSLVKIGPPVGPSTLLLLWLLMKYCISKSNKIEYIRNQIVDYYKEYVPPFILNKKTLAYWYSL